MFEGSLVIVKDVTDFLAYNDTLVNGQNCHYRRDVIVTSHFFFKVDPIEAKKVSV